MIVDRAYRAADIRKLEEPYLSTRDFPGSLMRKEAFGLCHQVKRALPRVYGAKILLLVGPGNNGSDTLLAGAQLASQGASLEALLLGTRVQHQALKEYRSAAGRVVDKLPQDLASYSALIDGILGSGARGGLTGLAAQTVTELNLLRQRGPFPLVVACDIPSGIDANSGQIYPPVLAADLCATFIAAKVPHLSPAEHLCGRIALIPLGIEADLSKYQPELERQSDSQLAALLNRPHWQDHKYSRGVVGLLAGSKSYPGAAMLAASAAVHTGCGMLTFFGPEELNFQLQIRLPEVVCRTERPEEAKVDAWALGPGAVGQQRQEELSRLLATGQPAVVDAAAIEPAGRQVALSGPLGPHRILTPHAGELARMLEWIRTMSAQRWAEHCPNRPVSRQQIEQDPITWVRRAARLTGATLLLKGPTSLIASSQGKVYSVRGQTAWLATAGSGDTLTGILASLLAHHQARVAQSRSGAELDSEDYAGLACLAARLQQLAALKAQASYSEGKGQGPVTPSLLLENIPAAIFELGQQHSY